MYFRAGSHFLFKFNVLDELEWIMRIINVVLEE